MANLEATLKKKIGPFPMWVWGASALALVVMVWYFRRGSVEEESTGVLESDQIAGILPGGKTQYVGGTDPGIPWSETEIQLPPPDYSPIYEVPNNPYLTAPTQTQTLVARQTSFQWGGRTWTSKDLAAFRQWLKAHGNTYANWAANHQKAAIEVFGTLR